MPHRSSHSRRAHDSRGFTLIEVLVTMVLMAIVIPVAMRGVTIALNASALAKRSAEAAHLAQQKMDELLSTQDPSQFTGGGDFGTDWPGYTWKADTTTSDDNYATLTIDVTYNVAGRPRDVQVTTLVSLDYLDQTSTDSSSGTGTGTGTGSGLSAGTPG